MQSIAAVEGIAKAIIQTIFDDFLQSKLDDSEYVRNIKSVIDGADKFLKDNRELINDPETLKDILYAFAKALWRENQRSMCIPENEETGETKDEGYYEYYFDYLYQHGNYPN